MTLPNLSLPDELADIRSRIKALEAREAVLRVTLLRDEEARVGKDYVAEIRETTTQRVDMKELRAMYPNEVAEHTFPAKTTRIVLRAVADQEAK